MAHPLFGGYLLAREDHLFFAEGELVHQDQVEANAGAQDIAFLVVQVLFVQVQVRESLEVLLFYHQIAVFASLRRILLLGVDPLSSRKGLLKASDLELKPASDEDVVNVNEIADLPLVEVLHDRANLGHDMQFGGEADGLFVLAEVLPKRDLLLVLVEDPVCDFFGWLGRKVALRHVRMLHVDGLQDRLLVLVLLRRQFLGGGSHREIA